MRNKKGITLVALIITIVILLILAVVTIRAIQDDGIIGYAQDAKVENEIAKEKEYVRLAAMEAKLASQGGDITQENMQLAMNKYAGEGKTEVANAGENLEVLFLESKRYYEVSLNGNVGEYNNYIEDATPGSITTDANGNTLAGTEDQPYEIWSIEDLVVFSAMVNGGYSDDNVNIASNQFSDKTVKLMKDLNFKSKMSYDDSTTTIYNGYLGIEDTTVQLIDGLTDTTKYKGFIPIGTDDGTSNQKAFRGTFEGNNKNIKNICENLTIAAGLFGDISNATIKDITVSGVIKTTNNAGGIVGMISYGSNIIGCTNLAQVSGGSISGGVIGLGYNETTISKCINEGEVVGNASTGGIVGKIGEASVYNCYNKGEITNNGSEGAGGIIGYAFRGAEIVNCYNVKEATITGNSASAGGIVGYTLDVKIYNSYNLGAVSGSYVGGILGYIYDGAFINNCYSSGNLAGNYVGGILGSALWNNPDISLTNTYYLKNDTVTKGTGNKVTDTATGLTELATDTIDALNSFIEEDQNTLGTTDWLRWGLDSEGNPRFIN